MKRFSFFFILVLVAVSCSDDAATGPSSQTVVFTAQLTAARENPPVSGTEGAAVGSATITFTQTASGYNVDFSVIAAGFPPTSVIFAGHIHEGDSTVNGPIRVNTGLSPTAPMLTPTGSSALTITSISVSNEQALAIFANPNGYYFNLHTPLNPGGVMRGQLVRR